MSFVVKAAVDDPRAKTFAFDKQRTMYGGKAIAVGDEIFIFASETDPPSPRLRRASGGQGLIARGVVTAAKAHAKPRNVARWTPRVSIEIARTAPAKRALGRDALKAWRGVKDGSAQAELDFKFYRQATNKICGISDGAAKFLRGFF
ncbi:MAG TPA: hypothetical protein VHW02_06340 [Rhizomicrobium sp.]|jgi:hypothetical protein|nr:hypothetical protein [Rhizomicrobium sp.]